jgi:hypothetical protein
VPPPEPELVNVSHHEDDHLPYPVDRPKMRSCPGCGKSLPVEVAVCVTCGYHFSAGEKVGRTFQPVRRHWDAGVPLRTRLKIFLALQVFEVALISWQAALNGNWLVFLIPWAGFTVLLAFVLGTFDRLDVSRNERGQVRLRRRWWICFWPRPIRTIAWKEYEGVVTGRTREAGCLAWLVILGLLPLGILPGILWWWFFVYRDTHFLALATSHGGPELLLYRGLSEERVLDMATVLQDTTQLPWQRT